MGTDLVEGGPKGSAKGGEGPAPGRLQTWRKRNLSLVGGAGAYRRMAEGLIPEKSRGADPSPGMPGPGGLGKAGFWVPGMGRPFSPGETDLPILCTLASWAVTEWSDQGPGELFPARRGPPCPLLSPTPASTPFHFPRPQSLPRAGELGMFPRPQGGKGIPVLRRQAWVVGWG